MYTVVHIVQLVGGLLLEPLVGGSTPSGVGLLLECVVGGLDPTCRIRVRQGVNSGKALKTTRHSQDRALSIGLHHPMWFVTNSHYSPCQLPAESGTWW
jgi:hypothetical protein